MKTQPEFAAIPMSDNPRHTEGLDVYPALQVYAAGSVATDRPHEHILRAALLANGCAARAPYKQ